MATLAPIFEANSLSEERHGRSAVGVDIGGTFIDAVLIAEELGGIRMMKVSSTPFDPSIGFLVATTRVLSEADVAASDVHCVVHGTTIATNAFIEGKVVHTRFVTTESFNDTKNMRPPKRHKAARLGS